MDVLPTEALPTVLIRATKALGYFGLPLPLDLTTKFDDIGITQQCVEDHYESGKLKILSGESNDPDWAIRARLVERLQHLGYGLEDACVVADCPMPVTVEEIEDTLYT